MTQTFEFKPALLARPVRVEVDASGAVLRDAKGDVKGQFEFSAAQRLRFTGLHTARGVASRWFDVEHGAGRFRLTCNGSAADDPAEGHLAQYRGAVRAILLGIEARTPGLEVDLGTGRATRIAMFSIGLLALFFGALVPIGLLTQGSDGAESSFALIPSLMMLVVGVLLIVQFKPWAAGPRIPVAVLAEALTAGTSRAGEAAR